jgi:hypothetical protein
LDICILNALLSQHPKPQGNLQHGKLFLFQSLECPVL